MGDIMRQTRWIVQLADPEQLQRIPAELLELATRLQDVGGCPRLLLRDRLSAYKIASCSRGLVHRVMAGPPPGLEPNTPQPGSP